MIWSRGVSMTCLVCRSTTKFPVVPTRLLSYIVWVWARLHPLTCRMNQVRNQLTKEENR